MFQERASLRVQKYFQKLLGLLRSCKAAIRQYSMEQV